ncbi:MAG TPA: hypothetical protein VK488_10800 [Gaiellaceae bacterium]|nr:hypothetical protein [Gaiellaceae bacterium]
MALPPEPPEEQPPPPPSSEDAWGQCPRCGTPYAPVQEYCLECGLRLPAAHGLIPVLEKAWRRRVPWYPGDWIWPVLAALVIAALGAAAAILANDNGSGSKTKAAVNEPVPVVSGTNPPPAGTATGPPFPNPTSTLPTTTAPTAPQPAPPPPATGGGLTAWPQGQNGWTIVLKSIPQSAGRAAALSEARKASAAGLSDVGVLDSSKFSSLHSGYWVVFTGVFNNQTDAQGGLRTARSSYPQAYVRQIVQ